jgi:hypothetical protein
MANKRTTLQSCGVSKSVDMKIYRIGVAPNVLSGSSSGLTCADPVEPPIKAFGNDKILRHQREAGANYSPRFTYGNATGSERLCYWEFCSKSGGPLIDFLYRHSLVFFRPNFSPGLDRQNRTGSLENDVVGKAAVQQPSQPASVACHND